MEIDIFIYMYTHIYQHTCDSSSRARASASNARFSVAFESASLCKGTLGCLFRALPLLYVKGTTMIKRFAPAILARAHVPPHSKRAFRWVRVR